MFSRNLGNLGFSHYSPVETSYFASTDSNMNHGWNFNLSKENCNISNAMCASLENQKHIPKTNSKRASKTGLEQRDFTIQAKKVLTTEKQNKESIEGKKSFSTIWNFNILQDSFSSLSFTARYFRYKIN